MGVSVVGTGFFQEWNEKTTQSGTLRDGGTGDVTPAVHRFVSTGASCLIHKSNLPSKIILNLPNFELSRQISIAEIGL